MACRVVPVQFGGVARVSDNDVELARTRPSRDQLVESDEAGIFIDLDFRGSNDPSEQRDIKDRLFSAALRGGVS
jgi:hypothetical protein